MATEPELIFPLQANHNFSRILSDLKRSNLSITNRLRSIREDAHFVAEVADAFARPLIANERCGSWYIPPDQKDGSAYFKSTDGHTGQWSFSLRRLNLHLLQTIGERDGCIIIDSTRRGKRMPDALSKTVPIWCCVLNRFLFPEAPESHALYTPPNAVSQSEHAQMEARIPNQVESLKALDISMEQHVQHLKKPLRPIWITPESHLIPTQSIFDDFHPVVCCTSSRRVIGGEMSEGGYIQGAGDDTENWALGLTPPVFWRHASSLMSTPEQELPDLVRSLVASEELMGSECVPRRIAPYLSIAHLPLADTSSSTTCYITFNTANSDPSSWIRSSTLMDVGIGKHKLASRNLRVALPQISDFVLNFLKRTRGGDPSEDADAPSTAPSRQIVVACGTGKDLSIGVALALLCQYFDNEGNLKMDAADSGINKSVIKLKLSRIMTVLPDANPSRATLQSVNSFLMG
ncbi:initiator tRNA phosphoribosyl transferase [Xylariomycetidae sp. FL2044]|nr:initiator tRNA phosphoribosyl transferase [Xylariomycetidae sp. FL2044]